MDIRPMVATNPNNRAMWIFAGFLVAAAAGTIYALDLRRSTLADRSLAAPAADQGMIIAAPPPLAIAPQAPVSGYPAFARFAPSAESSVTYPGGQPPRTSSRVAVARGVDILPASAMPAFRPPEPQSYPSSAFTNSAGATPGVTFAQAPTLVVGPAAGARDAVSARVAATRLANPATTVPQGTVIQAVLETALDSTRPGFARAIVSRDVMSFDGSRVLIAKGSRLFGEYAADLSLGQNRALIQWHRLTRPDGTLIDVDSPSADPLGRAGVKGRVNSHFFERFGGAILQSMLDIGVGIATRKAIGDTVFVSLPNSTQTIAAPTQSNNVRPSLKVRQGASVSVFVARDLDFTDVEP